MTQPAPLRILAVHGDLIAIDKPAGLLVIPGRSGAQSACARDLLSAQLGQRVWVCHRLDRDTSGVLVMATSAQMHRLASMAFEKGSVKKRYVALVEGSWQGPREIDVALVEGRKRTMRPAREHEVGKAAQTKVRLREALGQASFIEAEPLTGRQHQIRVHLTWAGHPLLFDHQYGRSVALSEAELGGVSDAVVLSRTPLHAESIEIAELGLCASAPIANDMARCLDLLRSARARPLSSS